jgi:hypothetical protein
MSDVAVSRAVLAVVIVVSFAVRARAEPVIPSRAASSVMAALPSKQRRVRVSECNRSMVVVMAVPLATVSSGVTVSRWVMAYEAWRSLSGALAGAGEST